VTSARATGGVLRVRHSHATPDSEQYKHPCKDAAPLHAFLSNTSRTRSVREPSCTLLPLAPCFLSARAFRFPRPVLIELR